MKSRKRNSVGEIIGSWIQDDRQSAHLLERERLNANIARIISERRREAKLSQLQLAKLVGTTQSVISRLENADYEGHSLTMLDRIAKALDKRVQVNFKPANEKALRAEQRLRFAFREVLRHLRRERGLSIDELAIRTGLPVDELQELEQGGDQPPRPYALYQLSQFFDVPQQRLAVLAGVVKQNDTDVAEAASQFAAKSESFTKLSTEDRQLFDEFVRHLRSKTRAEA
jgi:transcriptional regulator with XRE-family HTH domain